MTDIEQLRQRVAKACRILGKLELTNHILGHISTRVPGTDTVLIRARGPGQSGVRFTTADDVITVDLDGKKLEGAPDLDAPNEVFIHTWLYRTRPDISAVLHAHPATAVLFTICNKPLLPLYGAYDPGSLRLLKEGIPTYPRSVLVSNDVLGQEFAAMMKGRACLMHGHGITTCGLSVEEATLTAISLNNLAEMNYRAQLLGNPESIPADEMASLFDLNTRQAKDARNTPIWRYYCQLSGEEP
jgi:ribulose-5-phosphate 4-epimerase/fuculose-1-phosphate aldolase